METEYPLIGKIEGFKFPYLLSWLIKRTHNGKLILRKNSQRKILYFSQGDIAYSASSEEKDSIGHILLSKGHISEDQRKEAIELSSQRNQSLGRSLIELGYISPELLKRMASLQMARNILNLFSWDKFLYIFKKGKLSPRVIRLQINSHQLLFEAVSHIKEERWLDNVLGALDISLTIKEDFLSIYKKLLFNEEVDLVLTKIDGIRSANDIFTLTPKDKIRVKQILSGLKVLGIIANAKSQEAVR